MSGFIPWLPVPMQFMGLLVLSNIFMTFAWYAHLRNLSDKPWWIAALISWGIALAEYLFQVPANRIGHTEFSLAQLKITQEVITLLVLFALARFTVWGRQYWRITGDYFKGPESLRIWIWLAALLLSVIILVRIDVLISYFGNDLYTALQIAFQAGSAGEEAIRSDAISGFWTALGIFGILATIYISMVMLDIYITQRFIIRWRTWLTNRLTGAWLNDHAYYRGRFTGAQTS